MLNSLKRLDLKMTDCKNIVMNMESKYQAEHYRVQKWLEEQGML
jgi:hypothetical protein